MPTNTKAPQFEERETYKKAQTLEVDVEADLDQEVSLSSYYDMGPG